MHEEVSFIVQADRLAVRGQLGAAGGDLRIVDSSAPGGRTARRLERLG